MQKLKTLSLIGAFLLVASFVFVSVALAADIQLSGYGWSSTIGWLSFYGTAQNGSKYGMILDSNNIMSGYAWSPNIGWVVATSNPAVLSGFPNGLGASPVSARLSGNNLVGWARACSVFASGCSGALKPDSARGGWDGWVNFSGTGYGVTWDPTDKKFNNTTKDLAWGHLNTSWLSLGGVKGDRNIDPWCSISVSPSSANVGETKNIVWTATVYEGTASAYNWKVVDSTVSPVNTQTSTANPFTMSNKTFTAAGDLTGMATATVNGLPVTCTSNGVAVASIHIYTNGTSCSGAADDGAKTVTFTATTPSSGNWVIKNSSGVTKKTCSNTSSCMSDSGMATGTYTATFSAIGYDPSGTCQATINDTGTEDKLVLDPSDGALNLNHQMYPAVTSSNKAVTIKVSGGSGGTATMDWTPLKKNLSKSSECYDPITKTFRTGTEPIIQIGGAPNGPITTTAQSVSIKFPSKCRADSNGVSVFYKSAGYYSLNLGILGLSITPVPVRLYFNDSDPSPI